mmetsp:Transcript_36153/g.94444  ORF Transcript_36153/g.94444 Transcript_36153/m.94444 type:complete len:270 (-) Transcript_36153:470-1279(-)
MKSADSCIFAFTASMAPSTAFMRFSTTPMEEAVVFSSGAKVSFTFSIPTSHSSIRPASSAMRALTPLILSTRSRTFASSASHSFVSASLAAPTFSSSSLTTPMNSVWYSAKLSTVASFIFEIAFRITSVDLDSCAFFSASSFIFCAASSLFFLLISSMARRFSAASSACFLAASAACLFCSSIFFLASSRSFCSAIIFSRMPILCFSISCFLRSSALMPGGAMLGTAFACAGAAPAEPGVIFILITGSTAPLKGTFQPASGGDIDVWLG